MCRFGRAARSNNPLFSNPHSGTSRMKANAIPVLGIFERKMRLEVPIFQRQYVWKQEEHWAPLWEDIERKFSEHLGGRKDAPVHFLGAMVLDSKQVPITHVEKRQVIDGQQRLTTLQIFLTAFRDFCREEHVDDLAEECDQYILNRGMMADADVDRFKVWPTQRDRVQFMDVVSAGSRVALETLHPVTHKKYARKPNPRPRMVEAYVFLHDQLRAYFLGSNGDKPLAVETPLKARLVECFGALKNSLQVVAIDLEPGDDPQVIFETLNSRGEPLLPADLLRNFIFLRAARGGESQEPLYQEYWARFDDPFWREEVKQGRLLRPRSDLFMQHFLASRQTVEIPIRHLFAEYKNWIERQRPFATVREELETLARQREDFRRVLDPRREDPIYDLATFLNAFDIRTSHPLLLALLDARLSDAQWKAISIALESYLLRRAVCDYTTKNYNRVFLALTKNLRRDGMTPESLISQLESQTGESVEWPSDETFRDAWNSAHAYKTLGSLKLTHILRRLNDSYLTGKMESISINSPLTVEHILPNDWQEFWRLPDGSKGVPPTELRAADPADSRAAATRHRNAAVQTIGNLTLLTQKLNSAVSNGPWTNKKVEILNHSLLPLNQQLSQVTLWDEAAIEHRSAALFERALKLWPRRLGLRLPAPSQWDTQDSDQAAASTDLSTESLLLRSSTTHAESGLPPNGAGVMFECPSSRKASSTRSWTSHSKGPRSSSAVAPGRWRAT